MDPQTLSILYIVALFAILYFLIIRPQQQRQKKHQEMIKSLKPNDRVTTIGGIFGTIVKLKEDSIILRIADNVRIEVLKNSISQVVSKEEDDEEEGKVKTKE
ncbi:MAG TPA: preprotein translocase subunit YajC [Bacillota bacterium]|nr:preprotein translocase subunit YajC [Peptococcaceae bacterium MAG4]NLW37122.1 preprotein translocase subunit YajC [Peptococcaceae bacterium]HPU35863.1 preprotein translocase subunit YajC [Bacillota bacterium]HPZ44182.1 preprotein translocase subunit YajC [Bacillota bacterium]HQD76792.1 preprotein translocase subunit YajC [Bacillota bacterium]